MHYNPLVLLNAAAKVTGEDRRTPFSLSQRRANCSVDQSLAHKRGSTANFSRPYLAHWTSKHLEAVGSLIVRQADRCHKTKPSTMATTRRMASIGIRTAVPVLIDGDLPSFANKLPAVARSRRRIQLSVDHTPIQSAPALSYAVSGLHSGKESMSCWSVKVRLVPMAQNPR
jgi:hypothetical protein